MDTIKVYAMPKDAWGYINKKNDNRDHIIASHDLGSDGGTYIVSNIEDDIMVVCVYNTTSYIDMATAEEVCEEGVIEDSFECEKKCVEEFLTRLYTYYLCEYLVSLDIDGVERI